VPVIDGVSLPFLPAGGVNGLGRVGTKPKLHEGSSNFHKIFEEELNNIKFSAHAQSRLSSREVPISVQDIERLQSAVDKAQSKGSNESLIMMGNNAFIVNIPNKTVITVMDKAQMAENVITNIDSAVFA
jgi:flagellar operon protein